MRNKTADSLVTVKPVRLTNLITGEDTGVVAWEVTDENGRLDLKFRGEEAYGLAHQARERERTRKPPSN